MNSIVILSATRTPLGAFQGALSTVPAPRLGAAAIKGAVAQAGVAAADITDCLMGNVLSAGQGQAPARQAALQAGLPASVRCVTINKVCGSGLQAVMQAAHALHFLTAAALERVSSRMQATQPSKSSPPSQQLKREQRDRAGCSLHVIA